MLVTNAVVLSMLQGKVIYVLLLKYIGYPSLSHDNYFRRLLSPGADDHVGYIYRCRLTVLWWPSIDLKPLLLIYYVSYTNI